MTEKRKEPLWVVPFIRALERTGQARQAALDAGIDFSTAYARRRAHAEFAAAWAAALERFRAERARAEEAELRDFVVPSPQPLSREGANEELVGCGGQLKRAGRGRWSKAREKIFFEELAATANIRRSAAAAGVSTNAVNARRLKHPLFAAKWEAVAQSAKAAIRMHLLKEAKDSFDPDDLDTGDVKPRVTIDQAIRIAQSGGTKAPPEPLPDPFAEEAAAMDEDDRQALIERILGKFRRLRERERPDYLAKGWTFDESYDLLVPPGYVKGPDYRPKAAD